MCLLPITSSQSPVKGSGHGIGGFPLNSAGEEILRKRSHSPHIAKGKLTPTVLGLECSSLPSAWLAPHDPPESSSPYPPKKPSWPHHLIVICPGQLLRSNRFIGLVTTFSLTELGPCRWVPHQAFPLLCLQRQCRKPCLAQSQNVLNERVDDSPDLVLGLPPQVTGACRAISSEKRSVQWPVRPPAASTMSSLNDEWTLGPLVVWWRDKQMDRLRGEAILGDVCEWASGWKDKHTRVSEHK